MKKLCKIVSVVLLMLLPLALLSAEDSTADSALFRGHYMPGNVQFSGDAGFNLGLYSGVGLALYPEAEMFFTKFRPGDVFSIDISGIAFGRMGLNLGTSTTALNFGLGAMAGFHIGLNEISIEGAEILEPVDFVTALGLGFNTTDGLAFAVESGFQYFLDESTVIRVLYRDFGSSSDLTIGVGFKFGPAETGGTNDLNEVLLISSSAASIFDGLEDASAYAHFVTVLGMGGGLYPGHDFLDDTDGGYRWIIEDGSSSYTVTRGLIGRDSYGGWYQLVFEGDDSIAIYEYYLEDSGAISELRYRFNDEMQKVYFPAPGDDSLFAEVYPDPASASAVETIRVPAGRFEAYRFDDPDGDGSFWYSEDAGGVVIKYQFDDAGDDVTSELVADNIRTVPELGVYF